ncbi:MAG: extracellular solute-binding protein [Alphaproteobacteria bacterium]|nr:extracellular solute-binding protein [Alphaproteobacteria bacterium]
MNRIGRRSLLKLSGAGAIAASAGGLAGVLASGRAPALAQAPATVHWLRWNDFVPASDQLLKKQITDECQKALGIKLNVETINGNDIQARITSSIQSATGPDVICALNNWAQLYADSVVDVSDLAEEIGNAQGGFYAESKAVANDGKRWIAVPWCIVGAALTNRKSFFEEIGAGPGEKFPQDWEAYRAAGKKLKANAHPIGQTLGHTFGDAPSFWYPFLWSWGGKEVEADGKTVVLNSKETVESVKWVVGYWKDALDEGGLAWDDTSNNRAFLSGTISSTLNGASIYLEAKRKPDTYQTDKGTPMKDDIFHATLPKGPAGQFSYHVPFSNMLMKYSKSQDAARNFLKWISSKDVYAQWFESQQGFSVGATTDWEKSKVWDEDPVMGPYRLAARSGRFAGYAGPAGRAAAEAVSKYVVVDMYAKAVQGMAPEDAVKWAHEEMVKVYAA